MRQLIIILLTFIINITLLLPSNAALRGSLEYSIPIDYARLNEQELASRAEISYNSALKNYNGDTVAVSEEISTALNLYSILSHVSPNNVIYAVRLGKMYDIIGKDRYAKGNYYRAIGINKSSPEGYFYLGDYFYARKQYRRALKMYKCAYDNGYQNHTQTIDKLNIIYKKLGDESNSAKSSK